MSGTCRQLAIAKPTQFTAERVDADRDAKFLPHPLRQIHQPPTHNTMDGRDRAALDQSHQRTTLCVVQPRCCSRRSAVDQPVGAIGIETDHPIPDDLQTDTADPSRIATRPSLVNDGQSQEPPRLVGITRLACQTAQIINVKVSSKRNRCGHVEHPAVQHRKNHISLRVGKPRESTSARFGIIPTAAVPDSHACVWGLPNHDPDLIRSFLRQFAAWRFR